MSSKSLISLFSTVLALSLLLPSCSRREEKPSQGKPAVPVRLAQAERTSVPLQLEAFGTVEAQASVMIKSRVAGQLQRIHFREGSDVQRGDLLFTIDPQPYLLAIQQAEAALARDRARLVNSRQKAERYQQLLEQKYVSQQEYDQMQSDALADEALVRADQADLDKARLQLDYCSIRSPLSGRTGSLISDPGTLIKADDGDPLVVIHQLQPIEVSFTVPETQVPGIQQAMKTRKIVATALVEEGQPQETGEVAFLDNSVDRATGTIRLKALFGNTSRRLWPGQFVRLSLILGTLDQAVVVPSVAVQTGQQGTFLYVVNGDAGAEVRPIHAGVSWNGLTVVDGVQPGDQVVIDGQMRLYPGAKITAEQRDDAAKASGKKSGL